MSNRTILVLIDTPGTPLHEPALEALTVARSLGRVEAVALEAPSVEVLAQLGSYGVDVVRQAELPPAMLRDGAHLPATAGAVLAAAFRATDAELALVTTSFANRETAARAAHELGCALLVDATRVAASPDGALTVESRAFGGAWTVTSAPVTDSAIILLRANAVPAAPAETAVVTEVDGFVVTPKNQAAAVRVLSRSVIPAEEGRPALGEAAIVVAGGRGTGGDFGPVEDLADALGAAVGATRDAVYEGWFDTFIGQTGVTISPRLYIGAGISGAVHHRGGMQASQVIIAVNNDPECPLFEIADFAVIGDLAEVLPQAAAAIRKYKETRG